MRTLISRTAVSLLLAAAVVLPVTPAAAAACPTAVPADAHRGGTEAWTENTGNAFLDSRITAGVTLWETDVQFDADGQPWIMHDDTVDRTTDGTGAVASLTTAQMTGLRTVDGQRVPMLADLVNEAYVSGAKLFPELKTMPTETQWTAFGQALATRPMASRIMITSFDGPTLLAAQAHLPQYTRGLIQELGDQSVASVTQYGATALIKHHNAIIWSRIDAWQAGGLSVYSWTVDTQSEWQRMNAYPAGWLDGVITNDPKAYTAWAENRTC